MADLNPNRLATTVVDQANQIAELRDELRAKDALLLEARAQIAGLLPSDVPGAQTAGHDDPGD